MRLDQQRSAVLQRDVAGGETWPGAEIGDALGDVAVILEVQIGRQQMSVFFHLWKNGFFQRGILPGLDCRIEISPILGIPGQVVLVVGAIGGVHVDKKIRQPGVEQRQPVTHFRRIGLPVIAV